MLTIEQVKRASDVYLGRESVDFSRLLSAFEATRSKARILYLHNGRLSRLRIICGLSEVISDSEIKELSEEDVKEFIDWDRFTDWINKHDDLSEDNLLTPKQYSDYQVLHRHEPQGRNGTLDLVKGEVIDHSKEVLV